RHRSDGAPDRVAHRWTGDAGRDGYRRARHGADQGRDVIGRTDRAIERSTRLLVWLACGLMFVGALGALRFRGRITMTQMWIGLASLPLLLHLMSSGTIRFLNFFSRGLATSLLATRGEPHSREYSEQQ